MKIPILACETFKSIQGEGKTIGQQRRFIRLAGCSLNCSFCDTKYHTDIKFEDDIKMKLQQKERWCITGGEPLLQEEEVRDLIYKYIPEWVEIETNGTVIPHNDLISVVDLFNISPKDPKYQNGADVTPIIFAKRARFKDYIVKFVYKNESDGNFIRATIKRYKLDKDKVYIMSEGATKKEQDESMQLAIKFALKNKYNYSPRLHVLVWDNKKGV